MENRGLRDNVLPLRSSRELKNREKHKRFFENEGEYLIPSKIKRSDRCDTIFTPQNKIDFFYQVMTLSRDVLLGSTELSSAAEIMFLVFL